MADIEKLKAHREEWKKNISEIRQTMNKIKKAQTTIYLCYGMMAIFIIVALSLFLAYKNIAAAGFSFALSVVFLFIQSLSMKKSKKLNKRIQNLMKENERIKKIQPNIAANAKS